MFYQLGLFIFIFFIFFFFSSRRRHTRWPRDWSSDVCSSDLYANGDMVGHTGAFDATVIAVEAVDLELARLVKVIDELQGILVVTADHGNADEMFQRDKYGNVQRGQEDRKSVV